MKKLLIFGIIGLTFASAFAGSTCPRCRQKDSYVYKCKNCNQLCCNRCAGTSDKNLVRGKFYSGDTGNPCPSCGERKLKSL